MICNEMIVTMDFTIPRHHRVNRTFLEGPPCFIEWWLDHYLKKTVVHHSRFERLDFDQISSRGLNDWEFRDMKQHLQYRLQHTSLVTDTWSTHIQSLQPFPTARSILTESRHRSLHTLTTDWTQDWRADWVLTRHRFGVDFEDGIGWNINDERNDYSWSPRSLHHTVKFHAVHLNEPHSHVISLPIVHVCLRSLIWPLSPSFSAIALIPHWTVSQLQPTFECRPRW